MATAAKNDKLIQNVLIGGAVCAVVYMGYKFLTGKKSASGGASPYTGAAIGGGYGGYGGYGSGYDYYGQNQQQGGLLSSLLNALGAGSSKKSGSSTSGGVPGAGNTASYGNSPTNPLQTVADFVNAGNMDLANNNPLAAIDAGILDGTDSVNPANYDTSIQTLDVPGQSFNPYADTNANSDYSGIYTDMSQSFDPSTMLADYGGGGGGGGDDSLEMNVD